MVAFFVNPPEGAEQLIHSLTLSFSNYRIYIDIKQHLDHAQHPLVDLQKRPPWNFEIFLPGHLSFDHRF